jgi:hypothetical protein
VQLALSRQPPALHVAHLRELSGQMVELAVRVVDAREIRSSRGLTYYYLIIPLGLPPTSRVIRSIIFNPCQAIDTKPFYSSIHPGYHVLT